MGLFSMLLEGNQGNTDSLSANKGDNGGEIPSSRVQCGTKRKQDGDISYWTDEGQKLVNEVRCMVSQVGDSLDVHDNKGDVLCRDPLSVAGTPCRGGLIPVKALAGRAASSNLKQLELLVQDERVGRIAIQGVEGVGKTCLMKHLYNRVFNWVEGFDHVFWVTFSDQCDINHLQEAIAQVVKCGFSSSDNLDVRARKLSGKLAALASFVLFLDGGVPGADFSLDQVGIPVLALGSKCKVVLTTTSSSSLECRLLDGFEVVKVDPLPMEEAYELFVREARIGAVSQPSLGDTPWLVATMCCGLPRTIVDVATRMCGIDSLHEWSHAVFESGLRGEKYIPVGFAIH